MLLKIPFVISIRIFVSINVGREIFKRVSSKLDNDKFAMNYGFLDLYQNKHPFLEHLSLIDIA